MEAGAVISEAGGRISASENGEDMPFNEMVRIRIEGRIVDGWTIPDFEVARRDVTLTLPFSEVWAVDLEFRRGSARGTRPDPICLLHMN